MSLNAEDFQEEEQEPDFDPGYPFGGMVDDYDIDRENQLTEDDEDTSECDFCGSCVDNFHTCSCGAELTKKQCQDQSGMCRTCLRLL